MALSLVKDIFVLMVPPRINRYHIPGSVGKDLYTDAAPALENPPIEGLVGTNADDKPLVFETDIPIYLPNVYSVSRSLGINEIGTANISLTNVTRGVAYDNYLHTTFQRMTQRERPKFTFDTSDPDRDGTAIGVYEQLYSEWFPEDNYKGSKLGTFLQYLLAVPDIDPEAGLVRDIAFRRQQLASQLPDRTINEEYLEDYLSKIYDVAIEDKRLVRIYVRAFPRSWLGEREPHWVPYFTGYIQGYDISYTGNSDLWSADIRLQAPSGLLDDSQMQTNYVMVNFFGQYGADQKGELAQNLLSVMQQAGDAEGGFRDFYTSYWQGKSIQEILHVVALMANANHSFLGFKTLQSLKSKAFGDTQQNKKVFQTPVRREDYHHYDYIYAPYKNAAAEGGITDSDGVLAKVGVDATMLDDPLTGEERQLHVYFPMSEPQGEQSPYLWEFTGEAPQVLNLDYIIEFLRTVRDPQTLGEAWWFSYTDPTTGISVGPIRDKLAPRILVDPLLDNGAIFAEVIRNSFQLDDQGTRKSLYRILVDAVEKGGSSMYDDALGNLIILQNRFDDKPALYNKGQRTEEGLCFFDKLGDELMPSRDSFLLLDHDNRYIIGQSTLATIKEGFDSSQIFTICGSTSEMNLVSLPGYIGKQAQAGYAGTDLYPQTKYGSRIFQVQQPLLIDGINAQITNGDETVRALLDAFSAHVLRVQNARARNASVSLIYRTLYMQPGRNLILAGRQKKGYITAVHDSYSVGDSGAPTGEVSLQNYNDVGEILGNPWLELWLLDPDFIEHALIQKEETMTRPADLTNPNVESVESSDGTQLHIQSHDEEMEALLPGLVSLADDTTRFDVSPLANLGSNLYSYSGTPTTGGPTPYVRPELKQALSDVYDEIKSRLQTWVDDNQNDLGTTYELQENPISILVAFNPPKNGVSVGGYEDTNSIIDSNRGVGNSHWSGAAVMFDIEGLAPRGGYTGSVLYATLDGEPIYSLSRVEVEAICIEKGLVEYGSAPGHYSINLGSIPDIDGKPEAARTVLEEAQKVYNDPNFICLMLAIADIESSMGLDQGAMKKPDMYGSMGLMQLSVADYGKYTWGTWIEDGGINLPIDEGIASYNDYNKSRAQIIQQFGANPEAKRYRVWQWPEGTDPRENDTLSARGGAKIIYRNWSYYSNKLQEYYNRIPEEDESKYFVRSLDDVIIFAGVDYNGGFGTAESLKGQLSGDYLAYANKIRDKFPNYGGVFSA